MFISWFPAGPAKGGRFKKPYLNQVIIKGLESQRKIQKGKGRDAALPFAEAYFKKLLDSRLLKKVQMQGVEEREMRRTLLYAAITSDDDNDADGPFSAVWQAQALLSAIACALRSPGMVTSVTLLSLFLKEPALERLPRSRPVTAVLFMSFMRLPSL